MTIKTIPILEGRDTDSKTPKFTIFFQAKEDDVIKCEGTSLQEVFNNLLTACDYIRERKGKHSIPESFKLDENRKEVIVTSGGKPEPNGI